MKLGMLVYRDQPERLAYVEASRVVSIRWKDVQGEGLPRSAIRLENGETLDSFDAAGNLAAEYDGLVLYGRGDKG